jgi:hypothetical protein
MQTPKIIPSLAILATALLTTAPARAQTPVCPQGTMTQQLARFAGRWVAHGAGLRVDLRPRMAYIDERTYTWCGRHVSPPCDQMNGHRIVSGLRLAVRIRAVEGGHGGGRGCPEHGRARPAHRRIRGHDVAAPRAADP